EETASEGRRSASGSDRIRGPLFFHHGEPRRATGELLDRPERHSLGINGDLKRPRPGGRLVASREADFCHPRGSLQVHSRLGPGLLESAYEACLCFELAHRRIPFRRQVPLALTFRGFKLDCGYRLDLLVDRLVIVDLKSVDVLRPIHEAQLISYLKLSGFPV